MTAIANILTKQKMPSFLIEDVTASLKRIGLTLLEPDNMSMHANLRAVVPFASFTRFVTVHLAPPGKDSLDPKIVSLLSEYLPLAEALELQKSEESLNAGACYWRVILILKVGSYSCIRFAHADFVSDNTAAFPPNRNKHADG
jgi:hypothetical protein